MVSTRGRPAAAGPVCGLQRRARFRVRPPIRTGLPPTPAISEGGVIPPISGHSPTHPQGSAKFKGGGLQSHQASSLQEFLMGGEEMTPKDPTQDSHNQTRFTRSCVCPYVSGDRGSGSRPLRRALAAGLHDTAGQLGHRDGLRRTPGGGHSQVTSGREPVCAKGDGPFATVNRPAGDGSKSPSTLLLPAIETTKNLLQN